MTDTSNNNYQKPANKKQKLNHYNTNNVNTAVTNTNNDDFTNNNILSFNINDINKTLKTKRYTSRVGVGASVYLTAVLQYLTTEIIDLAAVQAKNKHSNNSSDECKNNDNTITITPDDIETAIQNDTELNRIITDIKSYKQSITSNNVNNDSLGDIASTSVYIRDNDDTGQPVVDSNSYQSNTDTGNNNSSDLRQANNNIEQQANDNDNIKEYKSDNIGNHSNINY